MKTVVLSFTLKGQDLNRIIGKIIEIKEAEGDCFLISGHMPRHVVQMRGYNLELVMCFEHYFPMQANFFDFHTNSVRRTEMADLARLTRATVYCIGAEVEGVAEELALYRSKGLPIKMFAL